MALASPVKILVVDDESELRECMGMILTTRVGAKIVEAPSGQDAVALLKSDSAIEIVICDYQMANGCGDIVFQYLNENRPQVPFILITSDRLESLDAFKAKKPAGYVQKPMIVEPLMTLVNQILAGMNKATPNAANAAGGIPSYCPIKVTTLAQLGDLVADIYIELSAGHWVKALAKGDKFEQKDLDRFTAKKIETLYFQTSAANDVLMVYQQSIAAKLKKRREELGSNIGAEEVAKDIMNPSIDLVRDMVGTFGWGENVKEVVKENIELAVTAIKKEKNLSSLLDRLVNSKGDVAGFCSSVAFVSCGIAQAMGRNGAVAAQQLALACFLQEITLTADQMHHFPELIRKSSQKEFEAEAEVKKFKGHVYEVAALVENWENSPPDVGLVLMQHHERPDGSGFPHGLTAKEIHPTAAILIVALDLVNFYNENDKADFSKFLSDRAEYYSQGPFRNVFTALMLSMAPKS